jgi:hypothetical protein
MMQLTDLVMLKFFLFMDLAPQSHAQASALQRWARDSAEVSS